jgi:hypothetical protein
MLKSEQLWRWIGWQSVIKLVGLAQESPDFEVFFILRMLRRVPCWLFSDVSGHCISRIFKNQASSTLENVTDIWSKTSVSNYQATSHNISERRRDVNRSSAGAWNQFSFCYNWCHFVSLASDVGWLRFQSHEKLECSMMTGCYKRFRY